MNCPQRPHEHDTHKISILTGLGFRVYRAKIDTTTFARI